MSDGVRVDDLKDLWRAGKVNLPTVAVQYSKLASTLHLTAQRDDPAFTRSTGGTGPLHAAWTRLRSLIQDEVAVKSYDNLVAAGEALAWIAEAYATQDHLNAEQLDRFQEEIDDIVAGPPDARPPQYVPEPPSSDDPIASDDSDEPDNPYAPVGI